MSGDRPRVAIVGAAGHVGSALMRRLSADSSFDVIGICRNAVAAGPLRAEGNEVRVGALVDAASARALLGDCAAIVNCAIDIDWPGTARRRTRRLLDALVSLPSPRTLVFFSTVAVYGTCLDRRAATFTRPRPRSMHGREKLAAERYLARVTPSDFGLRILRLGHVWGPSQWVSRALFEMLSRDHTPLPFDGKRPSNAVHIENVCRAVVAAIVRPQAHETFDLTDRPQRPWREIVDLHAHAIGAPTLPALPLDSSREIAEAYQAEERRPLWAQMAVELGRFVASLPLAFARSSPAAQSLAQQALAVLQAEDLERRLKARFYVARARATVRPSPRRAAPWLCSDEAPGPVIEYSPKTLDDSDVEALAGWYRSYSTPDALFGPLP